jgi:hypothetical protein
MEDVARVGFERVERQRDRHIEARSPVGGIEARKTEQGGARPLPFLEEGGDRDLAEPCRAKDQGKWKTVRDSVHRSQRIAILGGQRSGMTAQELVQQILRFRWRERADADNRLGAVEPQTFARRGEDAAVAASVEKLAQRSSKTIRIDGKRRLRVVQDEHYFRVTERMDRLVPGGCRVESDSRRHRRGQRAPDAERGQVHVGNGAHVQICGHSPGEFGLARSRRPDECHDGELRQLSADLGTLGSSSGEDGNRRGDSGRASGGRRVS